MSINLFFLFFFKLQEHGSKEQCEVSLVTYIGDQTKVFDADQAQTQVCTSTWEFFFFYRGGGLVVVIRTNSNDSIMKMP